MATHPSAKKRARQNAKLRLKNRSNMSEMRSAIKTLRDAIEKKDVKALDKLFVETQSVIARSARKGAIPKNNASRRIGRLALAINKAKTAPAAK